MSQMKLPMAQCPSVISESVAKVLLVHGVTLAPDILNELGRNVTQALYSLDESLNELPAEVPEPSIAERFTVGQTLRSLAVLQQPNAEVARALSRVGDWLVDGVGIEEPKQRIRTRVMPVAVPAPRAHRDSNEAA